AEGVSAAEARGELLEQALERLGSLRGVIADALGEQAGLAFGLGQVIEEGASPADVYLFLDPDGPTHAGVGATLAARTRRRGEVGPDPTWPELLRRHWAENRIPETALDKILPAGALPPQEALAAVADALHAAARKAVETSTTVAHAPPATREA